MDLLWWIIFWSSAGALAWVYVFYPVALWLLAPRPTPPRPRATDLPGVSVIVAARNEERVLRRKLDNCLTLDYPTDRTEVIVVSDGSTDGTDAILREYEARGVRVLIPGARIGKTEAQNRAVAVARQAILFFTDATTVHPPDVLRILVTRFGDPDVGCVSGRAVFREDGSLTSTGLRMKQWFDRHVRDLQSRLHTLFGATGCVYAVRRDLFVPLRPDLISDFVEPLELLARGFRTVYEPAAVGIVDRSVPDVRREFSRRARMALRGFRGMIHMARLLDPRRGVLQAVSLASQRPLKWLTPLYALGILASTIFLEGVRSMEVLLAAQGVFYGTALAAWLLEQAGVRVPRLFAIPLYFTLSCLASLAGMRAVLRQETADTWETLGR